MVDRHVLIGIIAIVVYGGGNLWAFWRYRNHPQADAVAFLASYGGAMMMMPVIILVEWLLPKW